MLSTVPQVYDTNPSLPFTAQLAEEVSAGGDETWEGHIERTWYGGRKLELQDEITLDVYQRLFSYSSTPWLWNESSIL